MTCEERGVLERRQMVKWEAEGYTPLLTTFSNWLRFGFQQAYPGFYMGGSYPTQTTASAMNSSCCNYGQYPMDAAYRTSFTFDYNGDTLAVDFAANCLQDIAEES